MKTKLFLIIFGVGLLFTACEKDDFLLDKDDNLKRGGGPPPHANAGGQSRDIATTDPDCILEITNGAWETPLIAGQHHEVGTVKVEIENSTMTVTYLTEPGWYLSETHLHVAKSLDDFPLNPAGNPQIGLFDYGEENLSRSVAKYEIELDNDSDCYYVAAHAVVKGLGDSNGTIDLEAFAKLLPETASIEVDHPNQNTDSYFKVHISDAGILNGSWPGWCIETDAEIVPGLEPPYVTNVFSSYDDVPGYEGEFLMKLNWILNQNFVYTSSNGNGDFTYGDVQIAIWTIYNGFDTFDDNAKKYLENTNPNPFSQSVIGTWKRERVNEILNQVRDINEYFPGCGDIIAIVFTHDDQDFVIEYPLACEYGEETAWGQGCLFVERGNWAMYFQVCP